MSDNQTQPTNPHNTPGLTTPPSGENKPNPPSPVIPTPPKTPAPFPEEVKKATEPAAVRNSFNHLIRRMEDELNMMRQLVAKIK